MKTAYSFVRTIMTFIPKYEPEIVQSFPLSLDSYCELTSHDVYSYNKTINKLIQSGNLNHALKVFEEMPIHDVVTWNTIISGKSRFGLPREAIYAYNQMVCQGITESASTLSSVLSICSNAGFYIEGLQVHCRALLLGLGMNVYIGSALVDLYLHMGLSDIALSLFNELPDKTIVIWNLILRGFCETGQSNEVSRMFNEMKSDGVAPNALTLCYLIRASGDKRLPDDGKQLHCYAIKRGWLELNVFVANSLVDFYSACGDVANARMVYEIIPPEDVISWNSLVAAYSTNGFLVEALETFKKMQFWDKKASVRSFLGFLSLSSRMKNLWLGKQIHCFALKLGFENGSVYIQSSLIDMYGKCGEIESSVCVFETVSERTLECCNSLMTSLLHCGLTNDVVEMFGLMLDEGIGFDEVSLSTTLKAISMSNSSCLTSCTVLHCCALKSGFGSDIAVSCSLIDSYSRSGHVNLCYKVFERIHLPNVICFTSIINAYARNGLGVEAIELLEIMIYKGLKPDKVTFLCVLMGCNHAGLVEEGRLIFDSMKTFHGMNPDRRHYSCMVDLLGRAGLLVEAEELLKKAPGNGDSVMWSSVLRSCGLYQNEKVGRSAAEMLIDIEPQDPATWLQASNFLSEIAEFETSEQLRAVAMTKNMYRDIGHSSIEVNGLYQYYIDQADQLIPKAFQN